MNDILTYTDYRLILRDYYAYCKAKYPWFSYECFCRKAGISSKGLLYNVVSGRRRLSPSHVDGVAAAMKLNESQIEYFKNLVASNDGWNDYDRHDFIEQKTSMPSLVPAMS